MSNALDNYITGHYGEDQFRGQEEWETFVERTCARCPCENWCPVCEKFYNGDDDLYDHPCLVLKDVMEQNERSYIEFAKKEDEHYEQMAREELIEEAGTFVSDDPCANWENDHIQFARLLAECEAVGAISIIPELCESMNLSSDQIKEIIDRAQIAFERMKKQLPDKNKEYFGTTDIEKLFDAEIERGIREDAMIGEV